jgi:hypothetical protein
VTLARGEIGFTQAYADGFSGWPLAPQDRGHGVYGTFLNPTTAWPSGMPASSAGYHQAIDILVDDNRGPRPVFAIEGGRVKEAKLTWQTRSWVGPARGGGTFISRRSRTPVGSGCS